MPACLTNAAASAGLPGWALLLASLVQLLVIVVVVRIAWRISRRPRRAIAARYLASRVCRAAGALWVWWVLVLLLLRCSARWARGFICGRSRGRVVASPGVIARRS